MPIVEYSELGDFIESPIRAYSSGMLGRLGFAIASAWTPDLLILDEVFAAGDAAFTRKCEKTLQNFRDAGVTILLVSHSAQLVLDTCTRALWLDHGHLVADGKPGEVVTAYDQSTYAQPGIAGAECGALGDTLRPLVRGESATHSAAMCPPDAQSSEDPHRRERAQRPRRHVEEFGVAQRP